MYLSALIPSWHFHLIKSSPGSCRGQLSPFPFPFLDIPSPHLGIFTASVTGAGLSDKGFVLPLLLEFTLTLALLLCIKLTLRLITLYCCSLESAPQSEATENALGPEPVEHGDLETTLKTEEKLFIAVCK